jgi:hypothetical protein
MHGELLNNHSRQIAVSFSLKSGHLLNTAFPSLKRYAVFSAAPGMMPRFGLYL